MTVTKRTRYEVLRRDDHTCRYCGGRSPEVELTVDHVTPTALGGSDDPSNLVAACRDCNAGKAASNPDAPLVAQVQDDALRWAAAMRQAAENWLADRDAGAEYGDAVARAWDSNNDLYRYARAWLDDDWVDTTERWRSTGVPAPMVVDAIGIAMRRRSVAPRDVWRYACGIVWKQLTELQEAVAGRLQVAGGPDGSSSPCSTCHYTHEEVCNFWGGWRVGYVDCSLTSTDIAAADGGHPDHFQMLALSLVVDAPAHEWSKSWPYPSELYPLYTGRSVRGLG